MALKVELKPHERMVVGDVVLRNGDTRSRLFIEGDAPILREKDILTPAGADTPAKTVYLAVQLLYLDGDIKQAEQIYFPTVRDFLRAAPSALPIIDEMNNLILSGELYKALKAAKSLIAYEKDLIDHAARGSVGVCPGRADDRIAAGA